MLLWRDNSDNETEFILERSSDGTNFTTLATVAANTQAYEDTTASDGRQYYRLRAANATENSAYANIADTTNWTGANVGTVTGGSWSVNSGTVNVITKGGGISGTYDDFRFVYKTISGDGTIIARVATVQNTNPMAKAGVMFRNSLAANSKNVLLAITPSGSAQWQRRATDGGNTDATSISGRSAPQWVKLVREGSRFTAFLSTDGTNWTQVGQQNVSMNAQLYVGLALSSSGYGADNTSTFTNVEASWQDHALPASWGSQDVGSASVVGSARYYDGAESPAFTFAVESSGQNVGGTVDAFHFAHRTLAGDGELVTRVAGVQTGYSAAKAGIMFRDGLADNAPNVFLAITAGSGAVWQSRSTAGQSTSETWSTGKAAPYWVKITRVGNTFTGSLSADGSSWASIGSSVTISGMSSSLEVGLALSAAGYGSLNTSTFDHVKFTPATPTLAATAVHGRRIDLSWSCATGAGSVSGYVLQRSADSGATWQAVGGGDIHATSLVDDTVSPGTAYQYRVQAFIDDVERGSSAWSTVASASTVGLGDGLSATYFDNADFTGTTVSRVDQAILCDWDTGSPAPGIGTDTFSVQWRGQVKPQFSENYTFYTYSDDGVRLWVNGQLLINHWSVQSPTEHSASIALTAGQLYDIRIEYFDNYGSATMHLSWSSATQSKQIVPTARLYITFGGTTPDTPELSAAAESGTSVDLSWAVVSGVDFYVLSRSDDGGMTYVEVATLGSASTSFSDTEVSAGTEYTYRLVAIGSGGRSSLAQASVTMAVPLNFGFELPELAPCTSVASPSNAGWTFSGCSGIAANGSAVVAGADDAPEGSQVTYLQPGSTIDRSVQLGTTPQALRFSATRLSGSTGTATLEVYLDSTLVGSFQSMATDGEYALYTVPSLQTTAGQHTLEFCPSSGSDATWLVDQLELVPVAPSLSYDSSSGYLTISWSAFGTNTYSVEQSVNGGAFQSIGTTSATSLLHIVTLPVNDWHGQYRVCDSGGLTSVSANLDFPRYGAPSLSTTGSGAIIVSWGHFGDGNGYYYSVERSTDGQNFTHGEVIEAGGTCTDSNVLPGTVYYYRIRNDVGQLTEPASIASPSAFTPNLWLVGGTVHASWTSFGSGVYTLERSTDDRTFEPVCSTAQTTLADPAVTHGQVYYYRVRSSDGVVSWSSSISWTDPLAAPVLVAWSPYTVRVDWAQLQDTNATLFRVERSTDDQGFGSISSSSYSGTSVDDADVEPGKAYYYRVVPVDGRAAGVPSPSTMIRTPRAVPIRVSASSNKVVGGNAYTVRLNYIDWPGLQVDAVEVDWGDGCVEEVSGQPDALNHVYSTVGRYSVAVTPKENDFQGTRTLPATPVAYDATFGTRADGTVLTDLDDGQLDDAASVARDSAGRLIVAGDSGGRFALLRYNLDGTLDTSFGAALPPNGKTLFDFGDDSASGQHYAAHATAMAIDALGRIYVAGDVYTASGGYDFAVARFSPDGTVDLTFGGGTGAAIVDFGSLHARTNALAIDPASGRITLAGFAQGDLALARLESDGTADQTFGTANSGHLTLDLGAYGDFAYAVKIDGQGRTVAAGRSGDDMAVVRLTEGGAPDATFGTAGKVVFNIGSGDYAYDLGFDAQERIIVAGEAGGLLALARLNNNGALDANFGGGDGTLTEPRQAGSYAWRVAIDADGTILVGGNTVVARYLADGTADTMFGDVGILAWAGTVNEIIEVRALAMFTGDGGAITVVGKGLSADNSDELAIMRLLPENRVVVGLATPSDLTATPQTAGSSEQIALSWSRIAGAEWYDVYRSTTGLQFAKLTAVADGEGVGLVDPVQPGTRYYYYVIARKGTAGQADCFVSDPSPTVTVVSDGTTTVRTVMLSGTSATVQEGQSVNVALSVASGDGWAAIDHWVIQTGEQDLPVTGNPASTPVTFADEGTYTVTADAVDIHGEVYPASGFVTVTVTNAAPTVSISGAASAVQGQPYALTLASTDPGDDRVRNWSIHWGDEPDPGQWTTYAGDPSTLQHKYQDTGTYTIAAKAEDEDGTWTAASLSVTVTEPPLDAPRNLRATSATPTSVELSWALPSVPFDGLELQRTDAAGNLTTQALSQWTAQMLVTGLTPGTTYTFRIRSTRGQSTSDYSNACRVSTQSLLEAPTSLSAALQGDTGASRYKVQLSWTYAGANHDGFRIYASAPGLTGAQAPLVVVLTDKAARSYEYELPVKDAYTYTFRIVAFSAELGESAAAVSDPITPLPASPSNLSVIGINDTQVTLHWDDNSAFEVTQYLEFSYQKGMETVPRTLVLPPNLRYYTLPDLLSSTPYTIKLDTHKDLKNAVTSTAQTQAMSPTWFYVQSLESPPQRFETGYDWNSDQGITIDHTPMQASSKEAVINAKVQFSTTINGGDPPNDFTFPSAAFITEGTYIVVEDMTGEGNNDRDYDDWYWHVTVIESGKPTISVSASPASAVEGSATPITFTFERPQPDSAGALDVAYVLGGSAVPGVDYQLAGTTGFNGVYHVHFNAGQTSVAIQATPLRDALLEGAETLYVHVLTEPGVDTYRGGPDANATITDLAPLDIAVDSNNDRMVNDDDAAIEDDPTLPGMILTDGLGDGDADGILDFADGYDRDEVAWNDDDSFELPDDRYVMLTLPSDVNLSDPNSNFTWKLEYPVSALSGVGEDADGTLHPASAGYLRLWTARSNRSDSPFTSSGSYVPPGTYTRADWLALVGGGGSTAYLYVEGVSPSGLAQAAITFGVDPAGSSAFMTDTANLTVGTLDLDVDSDNTSDGAPAGTQAQDRIEDLEGQTGKIIAVNDADRPEPGATAGDSVPDLFDGYDLDAANGADDVNPSDCFVPLVVRLPQWVDLSTARVKFEYDASDPLGAWSVGSAANRGYVAAPGALRIWTKDGGVARDGQSIARGGDFVGTEEFAITQLTSSEPTVTLYLEAVRASDRAGDLPVTIWIDPDGGGPADFVLADRVRLTAVRATPTDYASGASILDAAEGSNGNNPAALASAGPVRLADGSLSVTASDLTAGGLGLPWAISRTWSSQLSLFAGSSGDGHLRPLAGWDDAHPTQMSWTPRLIQATSSIAVVAGSATLWFDAYRNPATGALDGYRGRFYTQDHLRQDAATGQYVLTDTLGNEFYFSGFDAAVSESRGQLVRYQNAAGKMWQVNRSADGQILDITTANTSITESFVFTYHPDDGDPDADDGSEHRVQKVQFQRGGASVRSVEYDYYDASSSNGGPGDVKLVRVYDDQSSPRKLADRAFYVYTPQGQLHAVFSGKTIARINDIIAPDVFPDVYNAETCDPLADYVFTYDDQGRVSTVAQQGTGANVDALDRQNLGSQGTTTFTYDEGLSDDSDPDFRPIGVNVWKHKTTLTRAGASATSYMNFAGEVLLGVTEADGLQWRRFYRYDNQGRLILTAAPSAVTGYSESAPDLLGDTSSSAAPIYQYLADSAGLITTAQYNADGYLQTTGIRCGETGTPIEQGTLGYQTVTLASGAKVRLVNVRTVYKDDAGTALTTRNKYTLTGAHIDQVETTLPAVAVSQNGDGSSTVLTTFYDDYDRPIRTIDGNDSLTTIDYTESADCTTIDTKVDAATGGLGLTNRATLDALGRTTSVTDARGNTTTTAYEETATSRKVKSTPPAGPATVVYSDWAKGTIATATVAGTAVKSLALVDLDLGGRTLTSYRYHTLGNMTEGDLASPSTDDDKRYTTVYHYNATGLQDWEKNAVKTYHVTQYDSLGRPTAQRVGTDLNALATTDELVYDFGAAGDGNVTSLIRHPTGETSSSDRVTETYYDWRGRAVLARNWRSLTYTAYDNLGHVTAVYQYDGGGLGKDAVASLTRDATTQAPLATPSKPDAARLRALTRTEYDNRGRAYRTSVFNVNQEIGGDPTAGMTDESALAKVPAVRTSVWYDGDDRVVAQSKPGGLWQKTQYDGADRPTAVFVTNGGGGNARSIAGDVVLTQSSLQYDENGNEIFRTTKDRLHNATGNGELGDVLGNGGPAARITYVGNWYDAANRVTETVNFGTHGGVALSARPAAVVRSALFDGDDEYLITSNAYDSAGNVELTTDPRGIVTKKTYDALGRVVTSRQAYDANVNNGNPSGDKNQITSYAYDEVDHVKEMLVTVAASTPSGVATRTTKYSYGVLFGNTDQFGNNDLLSRAEYPGYTTASPNYQAEVNAYNALGEVVWMRDRSNVRHVYDRDSEGGLRSDTADFNAAPTGIDTAVRQHVVQYDALGRGVLYTSVGAAGNVVNQVKRTYNGLGQLVREDLAHDGIVTSLTPNVTYRYELQNNDSRLRHLKYPNGRRLTYEYADLANPSAVSSIGEGGQTLETYAYLGLNRIVERNRPEPGLTLTYVAQLGDDDVPKKPDGTPRNDGGPSDPYSGLDRFGRVIDQNWVHEEDGTSALRNQFTYDADSNLLSSFNVVGTGQSQLFQPNGASAAGAYDALNRRTDYRGGTLTQSSPTARLNTISPAGATQTWSFNDKGDFRRNGAVPGDVRPIVQARDATASAAVIKAHLEDRFATYGDTSKPHPTQALSLQYDGWGNLRRTGSWTVTWEMGYEDSENGGSRDVADVSPVPVSWVYGYDALGRRITDGPLNYYFLADGQILEERAGAVAQAQYVWSPDGQLVLRDRDADLNLSTGALGRVYSGLEERTYALSDGMGNTGAITDASGSVQERYVYLPEGGRGVLSPTWGVQASATTQSIDWRYGYAGGRLDVGGLWSLNGKEHDPLTGGLLKPDPLAYRSSTAAYDEMTARNSPIELSNAVKWTSAGLAVVGTALTLGAGSYMLGASAASAWVGGATALVGGAQAVIGTELAARESGESASAESLVASGILGATFGRLYPGATVATFAGSLGGWWVTGSSAGYQYGGFFAGFLTGVGQAFQTSTRLGLQTLAWQGGGAVVGGGIGYAVRGREGIFHGAALGMMAGGVGQGIYNWMRQPIPIGGACFVAGTGVWVFAGDDDSQDDIAAAVCDPQPEDTTPLRIASIVTLGIGLAGAYYIASFQRWKCQKKSRLDGLDPIIFPLRWSSSSSNQR